jgi:hypothetical protein
MQNYDVVIYIRGTEPKTILTQATNPVIAFDLAMRQARKWPAEDQERVVGITLKPEK